MAFRAILAFFRGRHSSASASRKAGRDVCFNGAHQQPVKNVLLQHSAINSFQEGSEDTHQTQNEDIHLELQDDFQSHVTSEQSMWLKQHTDQIEERTKRILTATYGSTSPTKLSKTMMESSSEQLELTSTADIWFEQYVDRNGAIEATEDMFSDHTCDDDSVDRERHTRDHSLEGNAVQVITSQHQSQLPDMVSFFDFSSDDSGYCSYVSSCPSTRRNSNTTSDEGISRGSSRTSISDPLDNPDMLGPRVMYSTSWDDFSDSMTYDHVVGPASVRLHTLFDHDGAVFEETTNSGPAAKETNDDADALEANDADNESELEEGLDDFDGNVGVESMDDGPTFDAAVRFVQPIVKKVLERGVPLGPF